MTDTPDDDEQRARCGALMEAKRAGDEKKLPCDVLVAPATIIRAGCTIGVLNAAIDQRRKFDGPVKFKNYPIGEFEDAIRAEAKREGMMEAAEIARNSNEPFESAEQVGIDIAEAIERAAKEEK